MAIKVINKCNLDENGNPKIVTGAAIGPMMYYFSKLFAEAMETERNIIIRPMCRDSRTGEIIARRYILEQ